MANPPDPARRPVLVPAPRPDLALDFANTRYWRGAVAVDSLNGPADLLDWCRKEAKADEALLAAAARAWRDDPALAQTAFAAALDLREALYRLFAAAAAREPPEAADLGRLNAALAALPPRSALEPTGDGFAWRVPYPESGAACLLAPVLWSAADLLVGGPLDRVRRCANDKCLWVFLDSSRAGSRRWCSMASCGNRAKAHRHYAKARQQEQSSH